MTQLVTAVHLEYLVVVRTGGHKNAKDTTSTLQVTVHFCVEGKWIHSLCDYRLFWLVSQSEER
jgi:hypothetical protein